MARLRLPKSPELPIAGDTLPEMLKKHPSAKCAQRHMKTKDKSMLPRGAWEECSKRGLLQERIPA